MTANSIRKQVLSKLNYVEDVQDCIVSECIDKEIKQYLKQHYIPMEHWNMLKKRVFDSLRRLDILQELVEDQTITEIMVNGPEHVFIERGGHVVKADVQFESRTKLEDVIQKIVSSSNRVVNESNPIVDSRLADGSRVNVVLQPVARNGPVLTIRKFPSSPITMERLLEIGSINKEVLEFLRGLVTAKYNIFISGGTGSGKTTFLNALSDFIPKDERVITIEDSAELQIREVANLVNLEARNANVEGDNEITIRDLIKSALRMRPDRIILGEVRDAAAVDLLSAMNTGHDGSLSTGHANSAKDMMYRLETLVLMGIDLPLLSVRRQIASALDIIIHLGRLRDKTRKVLEISEVLDCVDGEIILNPLYIFKETSTSLEGQVQGNLQRTENVFVHTEKLKLAGVVL
ncbi:pilus assembly protein CpaF [[Clostridium] polysaccharolyticum]|uniref:Pilus assembly protein CpaF n=1 Tax=[Clostridium] polysaccharolyticum TaxID=29364 RepID=A0A1I0D932_9FIRM|nr:CpaF family protein [[Clostridium] polysaccharolyticum]SET28763.1 pilus assembly protein CpaF [[Clostridium] polysaccharolyticum]